MSQIPEVYKILQKYDYGRERKRLKMHQNKKLFAIKVYFSNQFEFWQKEAFICKAIQNHENVIQLIDQFQGNSIFILVLEYCSYNLKNYLLKTQINQLDRLLLFGQLVYAFKQIQIDLSLINVIFHHRDIKPQNLMIGEDKQIKIIDFGQSCLVCGWNTKKSIRVISFNNLIGTPGYMDPMMLYFGEKFQEKSDLWSLGATLYFFLTNQMLPIQQPKINLISKENVSQNQKIQYKMNYIQETIDDALKQNIKNIKCRRLLENLLKVDPKYRFDWKDFSPISLLKSCQKQPQKLNTLQDKERKLLLISLQKIFFLYIQLGAEIKSWFISPNFRLLAGPNLSREFESIIAKGSQYYQTARTIYLAINQIFMNHWQFFEKCHYLLHMRSLLLFKSYNNVFAANFYSPQIEAMNLDIVNDLINNKSNQEIYERIKQQIYYLYASLLECFEGNGLEARILQLSKLKCQGSENEEYPTELQFENNEWEYFSYKQNNFRQKILKIESLDPCQFYNLFKKYLEKCINVFYLHYNFYNITLNSVTCLSDMQICLNISNNCVIGFNILQYINDIKLKNDKISVTLIFEELLKQYKFPDFENERMEKLQKELKEFQMMVKIKFLIIYHDQQYEIDSKKIKETLDQRFPFIKCKVRQEKLECSYLKIKINLLNERKAHKLLQECENYKQFEQKKIEQVIDSIINKI